MPLANLDDLEFGGWDVFPDDVYDAAQGADVLSSEHLDPFKDVLQRNRPDDRRVRPRVRQDASTGPTSRHGTRRELAEALREDIRDAQADNGANRAVMVWCGSTEVYRSPSAVPRRASRPSRRVSTTNDPAIAPSQLYAYAALKEGIPYANGAPNLSADVAALL